MFPQRVRVARELAGLAGLVTLGALLTGCFYDSRWGEAKASQKRVATQRMPSQLRTDPKGSELTRGDVQSTPVSQLRIRAYATPHYEAALTNARASFQRTLDDANPTLAHDLSFRLELSDYRVWQAAESDDDLSALLSALEKEDAADDVDWVVVLASPRNMVATGPDQLGVGRVLSRHLAIRAMSDAAEFDAIEQGFDELSEAEKRKLYEARKRHKSAGVLLHELGHTLGMPHELNRQSLMSATYDLHANAFAASSVRLAQHALALRAATVGTDPHRNAAQAALNALHGAPVHTYDQSSASEIERLLQWSASAGAAPRAVPTQLLPRPAPGPATAGTASPSPPASLSAADQATFIQVQRAQGAGKFAEAHSMGAPLFKRYPDVMAVQDVRCQLAMKLGLSMAEERAECAPLLRLSGVPSAP